MENVTVTRTRKIAFQPLVAGEVLYWLAFAGAIFIKCFYFHFSTRLLQRPFGSDLNIGNYKTSFGIVLIIVSLLVLLFNRKRRIVLLVLNLFFSLILLADTLYFRYYYNAISVPVFFQIGLVGAVEGSIKSLFRIKDIVFVLDFPFILAWLIALNRFGGKEIQSFNIVKRAIAFIMLAAAGLALFLPVYLKLDRTIFRYDNNYIIKSSSIFYFHFYDAKRYISENLFRSQKLTKDEKSKLEAFYASRKKGGEKLKGIAAGKNLIIVQVEALQQFALNSKIDGRELTPNLNKFLKDCYYFNNFYYQVEGGNTSDAELLSNASLYPAKEGAAFFRFAANTYYTLPKALKSKGYKSYAFHANNPSFWNRTEMYKALGFNKLTGIRDYIIDEYVGWGGWALSDASFFRQTLKKIDTSTPFYSFLISLSSHHPFSYFNDKKNFDVGKYEGTYLGNYMKAINYADSCLGKFLEDLKSQGLYDNSLLVMYGDHFAVPEKERQALTSFLGIPDNDFEWWRLQKVPLLVHYPGMGKGEIIPVTGGEVDIFPTVANLMDLDSKWALGKDLFNTSYGYALLKNGSVATDKYLYLSDKSQAFDIKTGSPMAVKDIQDELNTLRNDRVISNLILEKNALKSIGK